MTEITEYAKDVLRGNPAKVGELRDRQAISRAIESCGLSVITIKEMNVLLHIDGEGCPEVERGGTLANIFADIEKVETNGDRSCQQN